MRWQSMLTIANGRRQKCCGAVSTINGEKQGCHDTSPGEQVVAEAQAEGALSQPAYCPHLLGTPAWLPSPRQREGCCCEHCQLSNLHTHRDLGTNKGGKQGKSTCHWFFYYAMEDKSWDRTVHVAVCQPPDNAGFVSSPATHLPLQRKPFDKSARG